MHSKKGAKTNFGSQFMCGDGVVVILSGIKADIETDIQARRRMRQRAN